MPSTLGTPQPVEVVFLDIDGVILPNCSERELHDHCLKVKGGPATTGDIINPSVLDFCRRIRILRLTDHIKLVLLTHRKAGNTRLQNSVIESINFIYEDKLPCDLQSTLRVKTILNEELGEEVDVVTTFSHAPGIKTNQYLKQLEALDANLEGTNLEDTNLEDISAMEQTAGEEWKEKARISKACMAQAYLKGKELELITRIAYVEDNTDLKKAFLDDNGFHGDLEKTAKHMVYELPRKREDEEKEKKFYQEMVEEMVEKYKIPQVKASTADLQGLLNKATKEAAKAEEAKKSWGKQLDELVKVYLPGDSETFEKFYPGLSAFLMDNGVAVRKITEKSNYGDLLARYVTEGVFTDEYQRNLFVKQCLSSLRGKIGPQSKFSTDKRFQDIREGPLKREVAPGAGGVSSANREEEGATRQSMNLKLQQVILEILRAQNLILKNPVVEVLQDLDFWIKNKNRFPPDIFTTTLLQPKFLKLLSTIDWRSPQQLEDCLCKASNMWWREVALSDEITFSGGDPQQFIMWVESYVGPDVLAFSRKDGEYEKRGFFIATKAEKSTHNVVCSDDTFITTTYIPVIFQALPTSSGPCVAGSADKFKSGKGTDMPVSVDLGNAKLVNGEATAQIRGSLLDRILKNNEAGQHQKNIMLFTFIDIFTKAKESSDDFADEFGASKMDEYMTQHAEVEKFTTDPRLVSLEDMKLTAEGSFRQGVLLDIMAQIDCSLPSHKELIKEQYVEFDCVINSFKSAFEDEKEIIEQHGSGDSKINRLTASGVSLIENIPVSLCSLEGDAKTNTLNALMEMFKVAGIKDIISTGDDLGKCEEKCKRFFQYIFDGSLERDIAAGVDVDESLERDSTACSLSSFPSIRSQKEKFFWSIIKQFNLSEARLVRERFLKEKYEPLGNNSKGLIDKAREFFELRRVNNMLIDDYQVERAFCERIWKDFEKQAIVQAIETLQTEEGSSVVAELNGLPEEQRNVIIETLVKTTSQDPIYEVQEGGTFVLTEHGIELLEDYSREQEKQQTDQKKADLALADAKRAVAPGAVAPSGAAGGLFYRKEVAAAAEVVTPPPGSSPNPNAP